MNTFTKTEAFHSVLLQKRSSVSQLFMRLQIRREMTTVLVDRDKHNTNSDAGKTAKYSSPTPYTR